MKKIITFLVLVFCVCNSFGQDNLEQINKDFADKSVIKHYEQIMNKYGNGYSSAFAKDETIDKRYEKLKIVADAGYAPAQFEYALCMRTISSKLAETIQDGTTPESRCKLSLSYITKSAEQYYIPALNWLIENKVYTGQCEMTKLTYEEIKFWTNKKAEIEVINWQKKAEGGDEFAKRNLVTAERDLAIKYLLAYDDENAAIWALKPGVPEALEFYRNDNHSYNDNDRKLLALLDLFKLKSKATKEDLSPKEAYDVATKYNNLFDYTNGLIWMQKSAKDGYTFAQTDLGNMYFQGQGTPVNYRLAFEYWTKASDKGEPNATNNLSYFCYFLGKGITPDPQKAYDLITSIKNPETLPSYPAKLKEIKEGLNFINTEKKANLGDALAQEEIANYYLNGKGTTKSEAKALEYFSKSATQGNSNAEIQMADLYLTGTTTPFNDTKAYALLQKNSNLMSNQRDYLMGFCSYHGYGTSKNLSKALEYFNKSNDNRKNLYYAYYYYFGYAGVAQSYENAKSSLEKMNLDNEGQKFYDNVLGQLKYDKSLIMDTCPVCQGTGITYTQESYTYTTQEDAFKRETVLVYDPSSNFTKVENREKTRAVTNTGTKEVQHTCSRCNGSGKVHRY